MSRRYREKVTVDTVRREEDAAGAAVSVPAESFTVKCNIEPLSSKEIQERGLGKVVSTLIKLFCDSWPGGMFSTVTWNGRRFKQKAEVATRSRGTFTRGDTVILEAMDGPEYK